jgi:hypothetical protein
MGTAILAFLSGIATKVIIAVGGMIIGWVAKMWHQAQKDKQTDSTAVSDHQPLKDATTGDEIDKATDSALDHL